jgi:hypothetical protein
MVWKLTECMPSPLAAMLSAALVVQAVMRPRVARAATVPLAANMAWPAMAVMAVRQSVVPPAPAAVQ